MLKRLLVLVLGFAAAAAVFAQVAPTQVIRNDGYGLATWTALAKNDSGMAAVTGPWQGIKTAQVIVTTAGEQNLTLQGSMDGTNWVTLHGIELDSGEYFALTGITTSGLFAIIEDPLYVRPLVSNEMGATAVDIDVIIGAMTRN